MSYQDLYARWKADPEAFWMQAADAIDWTQPPSRAHFDQGPAGEWFADGMVNTCWNAIDRHVAAGHGDRLAIIHDSPMTGSVSRLTYAELQDQVARLAGVLAARGIGKGDRVIIYMPMIPEALQAMLACARIGAIHSVVFGGFAAHELAVRIDDAKPRAIIAASCGLEPGRVVPYKPLMDRAIDEAAHKPDFTIVFQRPECAADMVAGRDLDWRQAVADAHARRLRPGRGEPPGLYPLHLGDDGPAQGRRAPYRGASGRPGVERAEHLWHRAGRRVLGRVRRGLGRGAQLYRLWAADRGRDDRGVRRQARRHPRRGHVLAGDRGSQGQVVLHRAHRHPRGQARRPGGPAGRQVRPVRPAGPVPGGRTRRPRHRHLGRGSGQGAGDRPLVADGDRLAHRREPLRRGADAREEGQPDPADARLRRAGPGRGRAPGRTRHPGRDRDQAAPAARHPAHAVERRGSVQPRLSAAFPRLL